MPEDIKSQYSQYFTFDELTDSENHKDLVPQNRMDALAYINSGKRLSKLLESIRHLMGDKPVKVNSGFRNVKLNKAVGSIVTNSSHTRFEACDIVPSSMSLKEAFMFLMNNKSKIPDLRKCIIEKNAWLHVEVSMSQGDYKGFFTTADGINYTKVA